MARPSDALLSWLRARLDERGQNTASVSAALDLPRAEVRKKLQGVEPLTVDELLGITAMLELDASDLSLPAGIGLDEVDALVDGLDDGGLHWSNQPRALVEFGFELGSDFMLLVDVDGLPGDWGGPDSVRAQYAGKELPLRLDAAFHQHMEPDFDDEALSVVLSFDKLYRCRLPWPAIVRLIFLPFPPEPVDDDDDEGTDDEPSDEDTGVPHLRLVT